MLRPNSGGLVNRVPRCVCDGHLLAASFGDDPIYRETNRMRAYLFAVVVAYVAGMLSLSHSYEVMPYLVLGLGVAFHRIASPGECEAGWFRGPYLFQMCALSIAF